MKLFTEKSLITVISRGPYTKIETKLVKSVPLSTFILLIFPSCANSSSVIFLILYPHIFHVWIGLIMDLIIIMEAVLTLVVWL